VAQTTTPNATTTTAAAQTTTAKATTTPNAITTTAACNVTKDEKDCQKGIESFCDSPLLPELKTQCPILCKVGACANLYAQIYGDGATTTAAATTTTVKAITTTAAQTTTAAKTTTAANTTAAKSTTPTPTPQTTTAKATTTAAAQTTTAANTTAAANTTTAAKTTTAKATTTTKPRPRAVNVTQSGTGFAWGMSSATTGVVGAPRVGPGQFNKGWPELTLFENDVVVFTGTPGQGHDFSIEDDADKVLVGPSAKGQAFEFVLNATGLGGKQLKYYCSPHKVLMHGVIVVKAGSAP